jgi:hypothetical protein
MGTDRLRDPDMRYGLSLQEIVDPPVFVPKKEVSTKIEDFTGKRNTVTVSPNEATYRKLVIVYERPCHFATTLSTVLPRIYPFSEISIRPDTMSIFDYIETKDNAIAIVSDESFRTYLSANHNPPKSISLVSHILSLGVETPTLILPPSFRIPGAPVEKSASKMYSMYKPDWYDLRFPDRPFRIGTTDPLTTSNQILQKILNGLLNYQRGTAQKSLAIKPEIVVVKNTLTDIRQAFADGKIDGYFILTTHPNPTIQQLVVQESFQLLGLEGIDPKTYTMIFPISEPTILNTSYYGTYSSVGIKSMQHPIHIVASTHVSKEVVGRFVESVFSNFTSIKTGIGLVDNASDKMPRLRIEVPRDVTVSFRQIEFRIQMAAFSPDFLYPRYPEFPLHPGAESYFREIGVITNNPDPECGYTVGISNCKQSPHINPYRLMI